MQRRGDSLEADQLGTGDCVEEILQLLYKIFSRFGRNLIEVGDYLDQIFPFPSGLQERNHTDGGRRWKVAGDISYWTRENVRCIICDERYTGCLVCGKRTAVDVSKKQTVKIPKEDWIVVRDTHEAAVFEDYAEGRITRQEYLSCKRDMARQQEEMTAMYTELNVKRVKLQQMSGRVRMKKALAEDTLVQLVRKQALDIRRRCGAGVWCTRKKSIRACCLRRMGRCLIWMGLIVLIRWSGLCMGMGGGRMSSLRKRLRGMWRAGWMGWGGPEQGG